MNWTEKNTLCFSPSEPCQSGKPVNLKKHRIRGLVRGVGFCGLTGLLFSVWVLGRGVCFADRKRVVRWRNFILRAWARGTVFLMNVHIQVAGILPKAPFFLVSNHLSYLDIIVFAGFLECVFVAKKEVSQWPVFGFLSRCFQTIFVDRNSRRDILRVNAAIAEKIAQGQGVVLFAEGTSTRGDTVLPFKSSLLEEPAKSGSPVFYATITYQTPPDQTPAGLSVCWWGEMTFLKHLVDLFQLSSIEATLVFGPRTIQENDRKKLAERLWLAVCEQFVPVVPGEEQRPELPSPDNG